MIIFCFKEKFNSFYDDSENKNEKLGIKMNKIIQGHLAEVIAQEPIITRYSLFYKGWKFLCVCLEYMKERTATLEIELWLHSLI